MAFRYVELQTFFLVNFPDAELWEKHCELEDTERFWS